MPGAESLPEEALGGRGIPPGTEQKVDGLASGIDGSVEIIPLLLDLDVRLIDAIGVVRLGEMRTTPLVELRRVALHSAKHRCVIDGDPTLLHQFFDITVAQGIAEIPPHTADDDFTGKVTPFEDRGADPYEVSSELMSIACSPLYQIISGSCNRTLPALFGQCTCNWADTPIQNRRSCRCGGGLGYVLLRRPSSRRHVRKR